ncbi:MAG: Gfo/Idh/MocA family oxidoreductase [Phycisphaerae bacterium]|nr:Gfo/Idh/MocA family oxidoreductase [Phycisphaerae bacterium]
MGKARLGVIGCGVIGQYHLKMAHRADHVELVAVADGVEERARKAGEEFDVPSVYTDAEALLNDDRVDGVVLAFPTTGRTELALRALAMGKHVLTEKPVAMNAQEVQRMIAARGDRVVACCSSRYQFLPSTQAAIELVASGALGDLRVIHCRALSALGKPPDKPPPPWRLNRSMNGGGILVNWGCYDLDYLLAITGWSLRPKTVLARAWPISADFESYVAPGSDAETHFAALIVCEGGTAIHYERGEYVAARTEAAWHIVGTKGSLRLHMTTIEDKRIIHEDTSKQEGVVARTIWQGQEDGDAVHAGPVEDFAAAILEHREPKTSLEKALIVQKITDAIYASSATGRAVEMA